LAVFLLVKNAGAFTVSTGPAVAPIRTGGVPYAEDIAKASSRWSVNQAIIKAIIKKESDFDPDAVNPNDPSYGLMQVGLMVAQDYGAVKDYKNPTAEELAELMDPQKNINIGTRHLSSLLSRYPLDTAIQMYNLGTAKYNRGFRVPDYLAKVKGFYNEYKI
jgi:soluble lytic murein transglycosylase-like protein